MELELELEILAIVGVSRRDDDWYKVIFYKLNLKLGGIFRFHFTESK